MYDEWTWVLQMSGIDPNLVLKERPGSLDTLDGCPNEKTKLLVPLSEWVAEQARAQAHHIDHCKNEQCWIADDSYDSTSGLVG